MTDARHWSPVRIFVPLLLALLVGGCLDDFPFDPVHTFDPGSCPQIRRAGIVVGVVGTDEWLNHTRLVANRGMYPMLSCVGPASEQEIESKNGVTAIGSVDAQLYQEIDLIFNTSVVRIQGRLPLDEAGTLIIDLGASEPRLRWRGENVSVDRHERLAPADAIDPIERSWSKTTRGPLNETLRFHVTSDWNAGLRVHLFAYRDDVNSDAPYVPPMRIILTSPNGTVDEHTQRDDLPMALEMHTPALAAGEWTLQVRTGEPPQGRPVRLDLSLYLTY